MSLAPGYRNPPKEISSNALARPPSRAHLAHEAVGLLRDFRVLGAVARR